jgi:hypothetical protein
MHSRGFATSALIFAVILAVSAVRDAKAAVKPGIHITASNVSLSDTGSGNSAYTITSLGGFAGQVGVSCFAPELDGALVLPNCDIPEQFLTVPANGSVSGKMPFTPPNTVTARNKGGDRPRPVGPFAVGAIALFGLAAARKRRLANRTLSALALCAALLFGLTATGCGGHGGLAMSHGNWGYSIVATTEGAEFATAYITVTVH